MIDTIQIYVPEYLFTETADLIRDFNLSLTDTEIGKIADIPDKDFVRLTYQNDNRQQEITETDFGGRINLSATTDDLLNKIREALDENKEVGYVSFYDETAGKEFSLRLLSSKFGSYRTTVVSSPEFELSRGKTASFIYGMYNLKYDHSPAVVPYTVGVYFRPEREVDVKYQDPYIHITLDGDNIQNPFVDMCVRRAGLYDGAREDEGINTVEPEEPFTVHFKVYLNEIEGFITDGETNYQYEFPISRDEQIDILQDFTQTFKVSHRDIIMDSLAKMKEREKDIIKKAEEYYGIKPSDKAKNKGNER